MRYLHLRRWSVAHRELRQWIEAAALSTQQQVLGISDVSRGITSKREPGDLTLPSGLSLAEVEEFYIQHTLVEHKQNRTRTAMSLGIGRNTLVRKIKEYGK